MSKNDYERRAIIGIIMSQFSWAIQATQRRSILLADIAGRYGDKVSSTSPPGDSRLFQQKARRDSRTRPRL